MFIFDWTFALQGVLLTTISILGVVGNSMTVYVLVKVTDFTERVTKTFTNYECPLKRKRNRLHWM